MTKRDPHRWTEEETVLLATLIRQGGKTLDEVASELGISRDRISSKASQIRKELSDRGEELPKKFKASPRRPSKKAAEFWDRVTERVKGDEG